MKKGMVQSLSSLAKSQRGASFSVALLLIVVCVVISSIVLAASTASVGRIAEQGKMDQRYYSVSSAAQLFRDSLGSGDKLVLTYVQKREGASEARAGSAVTPTSADVENTTPTGTSGKGYDFLSDLTSYALFGCSNGSIGSAAKAALGSCAWGVWLEPFSSIDGWWDANNVTSGYKQFTYTVAPTAPSDINDDSMEVEVTARLHDDWELELDFHNTGADPADTYHLYMVLEADVKNGDVKSEIMGQTVVEPNVSNTVTVKSERATNVTWGIQQIVSGRGL